MQIALESLSKRYSKVRALDKVSLEINPGQIVSILGPNGAGKTTLLRCLSGIVTPTSGEIRYDGESFFRGNMAVRRRIAYLPDFPLHFQTTLFYGTSEWFCSFTALMVQAQSHA
jgi:ABC-type multidrug transport system ATPase subunit